MQIEIQILLAIAAAATSSFLQAPSNQLDSAFNSTFLSENERLFNPIVIPNTTKLTELSHKTQKTKANEKISKNILHPENLSQESTEEESKTTGNALKFSSRYSTKQNDLLKERAAEEDEKDVENSQETTEIPGLPEKAESKIELSKDEEISDLFSVRSLDSSEENKTDIPEYSESNEKTEESEIGSTAESPNPTSYDKYLEKESENFETAPTTEVTDSFEEKKEGETEGKRSVEDYYNSGSKNYHSIQTPLNQIKYQRAHSFTDDYELETGRKRIVSPIVRRPISHNWPFSKSQIKTALEHLNEISESDENYEKELDERVSEKVKANTKQLGLESAEEKDRSRFDRNKKYNYIELRDRKKQQQKALIAEEEKDDQKPLFQSLRQYQVDEEEPRQHPKADLPILSFKIDEKIWSTTTTPKNIFMVKTLSSRKPSIHTAFNKQAANFQGHQFLGPVVFNQNLDLQKNKPVVKAQKEPSRNIFLKGLAENEKLDHNNLTNQKFQKSVIRTGVKGTQSFDHLKESDEMYNAILANIQSVFGLRTQTLKSGTRSKKGSALEVNLNESKALTWSLPLIKDY